MSKTSVLIRATLLVVLMGYVLHYLDRENNPISVNAELCSRAPVLELSKLYYKLNAGSGEVQSIEILGLIDHLLVSVFSWNNRANLSSAILACKVHYCAESRCDSYSMILDMDKKAIVIPGDDSPF